MTLPRSYVVGAILAADRTPGHRFGPVELAFGLGATDADIALVNELYRIEVTLFERECGSATELLAVMRAHPETCKNYDAVHVVESLGADPVAQIRTAAAAIGCNWDLEPVPSDVIPIAEHGA